MTNKNIFLSKLQTEAKKQAALNAKSLLPKKLQGMAALVAKYPWQVILILSLVSALIIEIIR